MFEGHGRTEVDETIPLLSEIIMHSHLKMAVQTGSSHISDTGVGFIHDEIS